jgi:hypothetical protein
MPIGRRRRLARMADEIDRLAREDPFGEIIEVDGELAGFMGAFAEEAVGPGDFLRPGTWRLPAPPGDAGGGGAGHGLGQD